MNQQEIIDQIRVALEPFLKDFVGEPIDGPTMVRLREEWLKHSPKPRLIDVRAGQEPGPMEFIFDLEE